MRTVLLLPLALAAAVAAGGCGTASDGSEQTAFQVPQRDLTLQQAESPEVDVASPVELARSPVQPRTTHRPQRARRPAPVLRAAGAQPEDVSAAAAPAPAPARVAPVSLAAASEAASATETPDPHALAPGESVTIIPASSGPATDAGPADAPPPEAHGGLGVGMGGHGGRCRPRGTGGGGVR